MDPVKKKKKRKKEETLEVYWIDVNKPQLCDQEPILFSSHTARREYGNFSFLPDTRRRQSAPSRRLGDPDLCPKPHLLSRRVRKGIRLVHVCGKLLEKASMTATN